jgi:hypothetical protein
MINNIVIITTKPLMEKLLDSQEFNNDFFIFKTREEAFSPEGQELLQKTKVIIDATLTNDIFNNFTRSLKSEIDTDIYYDYVIVGESRLYNCKNEKAELIKILTKLKSKFCIKKESEFKIESIKEIKAKNNKGETYFLVREKEEKTSNKHLTIQEVQELSRVFDIIDSIVD